MNESVDIRASISPNSSQLNADDLIGQPRTIRVTSVKAHSADQPIAVYFDGDNGKPYLPCKSMRRVLVAAWGDVAADWIGRSMTLYSDPEVVFGGVKVGGIRISHVSHIDQPLSILLTTTRSKRKPYLVKPLKAEVRPMQKGAESVQKDRPPLDLAPPTESDAVLLELIRRMNEAGGMLELAAIAHDVRTAPLTDAQRDHARAVYLERRDALANQE
jgi:hypothetical protein